MSTNRELSRVAKLVKRDREADWITAARAAVAGMDAGERTAAQTELQAYRDPADTSLPHMPPGIQERIRDDWAALWAELIA